ncbi:MAG: uroporphyrinogen-III decarboxylase-like protein, partial [Bacteroidota bacterium]
MTPRERWLALFAGEKPDRIPTDYWATDEVTERLLRELRCNNVEELYTSLHIDGLVSISPPRTFEHHPDDPEADIWGVRTSEVDYGTGVYKEFANHPLAGVKTVEEMHAFKWPSAEDHDYEHYRRAIAEAPHHRIVRSGEFEPFLIYCAM